MRPDVVMLIGLHNAMQFINQGILESKEANDAVKGLVDDTKVNGLLSSIKAMKPTHAEILQGLYYPESHKEVDDLILIYKV